MLLLLAGLAGLSAGCDRGWRETPYGTPPPRFEGDPRAAQEVTVQPGDSVYAIARRTGVPMRAIIVANGLTPPFGLQPGQRLSLPAQRVHRVGPGETLYGLSRRYGPSVSAIANANGLAPPYLIRANEALVIPTAPSTPAPTARLATPPPAPAVAAAPAPVSDGTIPWPTEPDPPAQTRLAALPDPRVGDPAPLVPSARPAEAPLSESSGSPAPAPAPASVPVPVPQAGEPPPPPPMPTPAMARSAVPMPEPPPRTGSRFAWPVQGTVLAGFGSDADGLHNDGINIAVPEGTPVRAAEAGVVVYAGNEIAGFGNLVLIRHADGWMTAYAHARRLTVRRGETVTRGQVVAESGRTGSVDRPQVHFEIRRNARPVDPRDHLGSPGGA